MKVQASTAILCDAATVREGLLHILGGGVSALGRPGFPAPLNVDLALVLEFRDLEADLTSHRLTVELQQMPGNNVVSSFEATFEIDASSDRSFQEWAAVVPVKPMGLPEPGDYDFVVRCDSRVMWRKRIEAEDVG